MRKYKRHLLAKMKKFLPGILALIMAGSSAPAFASEAITVPEGTADNLSTATNPEGSTIDIFAVYGGYGTGALAAPPMYFFGMGAIKDYSLSTSIADALSKNDVGDYAYLVNNGTITLSFKDVLALYGGIISDERPSPAGYYSSFMGRGLQAGAYSTLINNGTINLLYDEGDTDINMYSHGMNAGSNSTLINNGSINIIGDGSTNAQIRGLATMNTNMLMQNFGSIYIDVKKTAMSRALANTGSNSLLENYGTIFNRANGLLYGMAYNTTSTLNNFGKIDVIYNADSSATSTTFLPGAMGLVAQSGGNIYNAGVLNVSTVGNYASATAHDIGIMVANYSTPGTGDKDPVDTGNWVVDNIGVIKHSSVIQPSADNNYIVRSSEIGINLIDGVGDAFNPVNLKFNKYATELRDFGTTEDFIQVARHSKDTDGEYKYTIDFSDANLIFRPSAGYTAGTAYTISADTLVTPVDGNSLDSLADITGLDTITFSSEVEDIISVNAVENSDGSYSVSLTPTTQSDKTQRLLNTAAMLPIDFTRSSMDRVDHELTTNQDKWFLTPYYTRSKRNEGMKGRFHGYIGGSNWKLGEKISGGIHLAYSLGNGEDGNRYTSVNSTAVGIHMNYTPEVDKNWIRANITYMHNNGDSYFSRPSTTGIILNGNRSESSNNFYVSLSVGQKNRLNERSNLLSDIGLTYLNMNNSNPINWTFMDEDLPGYQMSVDKYNALYAVSRVGIAHKFSDSDDSGSLSFGVGLRGRLSAKEIELGMMNTKLNGSVREDPVQGTVSLLYNQPFSKNTQMKVGYQGVYGKDLKNHGFFASFNASF